MNIVNNNISPLPFYDDKLKQNHRKFYTFGQFYPLITLANYAIPFQFYINTHIVEQGTDFYAYAVKVNAVGGQITDEKTVDITDDVIDDLYVFAASDGLAGISYPAIAPLTGIEDEGLYYIKLDFGTYSFYSEIFCAKWNVSEHAVLKYRNSYNIVDSSGQQINFDSSFFFKCYLPVSIGKPTYSFEEEVVKRMGQLFIESQISKKTYKCSFVAPEYLCDALRIACLCNNRQLSSDGLKYSDISSMSMDVDWEVQGDLAHVELSFDTDTVVANLGGHAYEKFEFPDDPEAARPGLRPGSITVKAIDDYTKQPVPGALIRINGNDAGITDDSGVLIIDKPEFTDGIIYIAAQKEGEYVVKGKNVEYKSKKYNNFDVETRYVWQFDGVELLDFTNKIRTLLTGTDAAKLELQFLYFINIGAYTGLDLENKARKNCYIGINVKQNADGTIRFPITLMDYYVAAYSHSVNENIGIQLGSSDIVYPITVFDTYYDYNEIIGTSFQCMVVGNNIQPVYSTTHTRGNTDYFNLAPIPIDVSIPIDNPSLRLIKLHTAEHLVDDNGNVIYFEDIGNTLADSITDINISHSFIATDMFMDSRTDTWAYNRPNPDVEDGIDGQFNL